MKPLLNIRPTFFFICCLLASLLSACSIPDSTPLSRFNLAEDGVYDADIHAEKQLAVVSEVSGAIKVHNLANNQVLYSWRHQGDGLNLVDNVKFSKDGNFVITSDSEAFAVWEIATGEPIGFWRIDESSIRDIAIANGGKAVLVGRANGTVMFFEPGTERRLEFIGHEEKINSVDLSANGRYALTGGNDYKAYLWDTKNGQIIHVFDHPHRVSQVLIDQNAKYLFTADGLDKAQIWDAQTGQEVSRLHFIERQLIFTSARFSADSKRLLTGSPAKRLALWDVQTGKILKEWRVAPNDGPAPQSAVVYAVDYMTGGAASISSSGNYEIWQTP
ncbi:WD40 repeat domain-containing protein [Glaciecola sp. 2405UD65-10]|uniref:WD40 repeat domain-containing protein n=1 Tax=Glaciecola sp. 2405UD65-10 TaxID=3397244 RepID=UPI003B5908DA